MWNKDFIRHNNNINNQREISIAPQNAETNSEAQVIAHTLDA